MSSDFDSDSDTDTGDCAPHECPRRASGIGDACAGCCMVVRINYTKPGREKQPLPNIGFSKSLKEEKWPARTSMPLLTRPVLNASQHIFCDALPDSRAPILSVWLGALGIRIPQAVWAWVYEIRMPCVRTSRQTYHTHSFSVSPAQSRHPTLRSFVFSPSRPKYL